MATERFPLHSWKLGNQTKLRWPNRFTPDTFRRTNASRTVARAEFFGSAAGGITEADGNSAGIAASSVFGAALWNTDGASTGLGTPLGAGVALWNTGGASSGLGTPLGVGAALWNALASSAGVATDSVVSSAIWLGTGSASGIAEALSISAALAAALGSGAGIAVVTGDGEEVLGGPADPTYWARRTAHPWRTWQKPLSYKVKE